MPPATTSKTDWSELASMAATLDGTLNLESNPPVSAICETMAEDARVEPGCRSRRPAPGWIAGTAGLLGVAVVAGYGWWRTAEAHVNTDNACIAANIHQVSSRVAGTVVQVAFQDNQRIEADASLVMLDPRDLDLRVEQARNAVAKAGGQLVQAEAQSQQARAQRAQIEAKAAKAEAELNKARLDLERAQRLTESGRFTSISRQEFDATQAAYDVAQSAVGVVAADRAAAQAALEAALAAHVIAQAQQAAARVELADAELQRSYATISAPVTGTVGRRNVEVGQRVQPGQALLALVADEKWVIANFKETQLARMRVGQRVTVWLDAIPGKSFAARIESFSPASGAQFALLPPDNATGNFTKVVQRVPVKIVFEPGALRGFEEKIAPGLSAVARVELRGT
jgi:membrane fusion protein, multidrug efflux system